MPALISLSLVTLITAGLPDPKHRTESPNVLGACTRAGAPCADGKGLCLPSMNEGAPQCLALKPPNGRCPPGAFGAETAPGKRLCLDLCTTAQDCLSGFFCNPTVLEDENREPTSVSVCMPGFVNRVGTTCHKKSESQGSDPDLTCVGASASTTGLCAKACAADAECQGGKDQAPPVCDAGDPKRERLREALLEGAPVPRRDLHERVLSAALEAGRA